MLDAWLHLQWVDAAMLGVLLLSTLVGLWRGFIFEIASLLGWVVSYFAAQKFAPWAMAHLPKVGEDPAVQWGLAFAACFLAALLLWSMAARLLRFLIHATPLNWPDRGLGALFGALRGAVVLLVLVTLVSLSPMRLHEAWQASTGRVWLERLLEGLKPFLPSDLVRHLPA